MLILRREFPAVSQCRDLQIRPIEAVKSFMILKALAATKLVSPEAAGLCFGRIPSLLGGK